MARNRSEVVTPRRIVLQKDLRLLERYKNRLHAVIVALRDGVELMVVAARAADYSFKGGNDVRLSNFFVLAAMMVALAPSSTLACSCVEVSGAPDTREWLRETDEAIFVGEVLKIEELEVPLPGQSGSFTLERDVTFKVLKRWKRAESRQISIRTGIGGGDCGFPFVEGKQYFVSARQLQGRLTTGICSSTQKLSDELSDAKKLIKELDEITRGR